MDTNNLFPLLEKLDDDLDDLEEALEPFLGKSLVGVSKNLPVMDKAKLHVLVTYTLESLIFSYLRLHGVDAKNHPVFQELTRVKQYFEKIKSLEAEPEQRSMTLDKDAATRFIKHGLAGNEKYDLERAEREAKEKARAAFKASMIAKKMAATSSSAVPPSDKSTSNDRGDSDAKINTEIKIASEYDKEKKRGKHEKAKPKRRKQGKPSKADLIDEKKERRQKKEQTRQSRQGRQES
ncbi:uncharacterized protein N7483_007740 [Penicillium malachiteum]|uniref:uncharacterized protein n=1 Tax=Penicillium malachiteum TaxID=1324776 RepID=UPI002549A7EF|nr:uncharacterized protein N7483_007740 [Penicillium malachiteum]KAJ5726383.1 hypothetical protein N7483_007740 [Penicillium malachiteum]